MDLKIIVDHRENKGQLPRFLYEKDIQIETKALEKLQKSMINASKSKNLIPKN